ncbi:MAG TPA: Type 1 glutamine amidotransferase-like domain-containing protein [Pyrinomonadaceae bacterium]|nr:Type 1 glutamine amidotransferase-like domain-containing protein [Pyrinomonadaceae bacterium]
MPNRRLLLLSNSTTQGEPYLQFALPHIKDFLGASIKRVLFAGVRWTFDEYAATVRERITEFIIANPEMRVVGLPEGTVLRVKGTKISLVGQKPARVFQRDGLAVDYTNQDSLDFLLH